jgi:hypothetical protein
MWTIPSSHFLQPKPLIRLLPVSLVVCPGPHRLVKLVVFFSLRERIQFDIVTGKGLFVAETAVSEEEQRVTQVAEGGQGDSERRAGKWTGGGERQRTT